MGGNVACLYAGVFPERVERLVTMEGFGLKAQDADLAPARYRQWIERLGDPAAECYPDEAALGERIGRRHPRLSAETVALLARNWGTQDGGAWRLKADPRHRRPNPVLYRRAEAEACWAAIRVPLLAIEGECSGADAGSGAFRDFFAARGDGMLHSVVIKNAGHMLHLERPDAVASCLKDFLEG